MPRGHITGAAVTHRVWLATGTILTSAVSVMPGRAAPHGRRDACIGLAGGAAAGTRRGRLHVAPATVAPGFPVTVTVTGLGAGQEATIHALSAVPDDSGRPEPYYASATFRADSQGRLGLATSSAVSGTYHGVDARGLFWSARRVSSDSGARAVSRRLGAASVDRTSGRVTLVLEAAGVVDDCAEITFQRSKPSTTRIDVRARGIVGVFYSERGARYRPTVVVLGGSEGGLDVADWIGPRLVARGYAVFGLEYVSPPGQSTTGVAASIDRIPVELFDSVRTWLALRPEVAIDRVAVLGYSKGGELALVLASMDRWIRAVVAYAPSDVVWQGITYRADTVPHSSWTRDGRDLPFIPTTGTREAIGRGRRDGTPILLAPVARANLAAASLVELRAAAIPLERSDAALLLFGGADDQLWDSGASVARLAARLQAVRYAHFYRGMVYPGAGHALVGTGWQPTTTDNDDQFRNGGTAEADAHAQRDSWAAVMAFLDQQLHR